MNDKNIKKQPSAQALSDSSLENVAGGYALSPYDYKDGKFSFRLSTTIDERNWLEAQGYSAPRDKYIGGVKFMIGPNGDVVSSEDIADLLKANGFQKGTFDKGG